LYNLDAFDKECVDSLVGQLASSQPAEGKHKISKNNYFAWIGARNGRVSVSGDQIWLRAQAMRKRKRKIETLFCNERTVYVVLRAKGRHYFTISSTMVGIKKKNFEFVPGRIVKLSGLGGILLETTTVFECKGNGIARPSLCTICTRNQIGKVGRPFDSLTAIVSKEDRQAIFVKREWFSGILGEIRHLFQEFSITLPDR